MESLYDGLTGIGVRRERINLRVVRFRDGVNPEVKPTAAARIGHIAMVSCRCGSRNPAITVAWSRDRGTSLELAEAVGLALVFGCRSGICGTCATQIISGLSTTPPPPPSMKI